MTKVTIRTQKEELSLTTGGYEGEAQRNEYLSQAKKLLSYVDIKEDSDRDTIDDKIPTKIRIDLSDGAFQKFLNVMGNIMPAAQGFNHEIKSGNHSDNKKPETMMELVPKNMSDIISLTHPAVKDKVVCHPDQEVAIYVLSDPGEKSKRQIIRETWGSRKVFWLSRAKVFFVVGTSSRGQAETGEGELGKLKGKCCFQLQKGYQRTHLLNRNYKISQVV